MELSLIKALADVPLDRLVVLGEAWMIFHLMRHNRALTAAAGLLARKLDLDELDPTRDDLITPDAKKKEPKP